MAFIGDIDRIIKINKYIMPILILFIMYAGIKSCRNANIDIHTEFSTDFIMSSIIYAGYNLLPLIPILIPLKNEIKTYKQINQISIITFVTILISAISVYIITSISYIKTSEIAIIEATREFGAIFEIMFGIVILLAIYTSAVCAGYSFANNIAKTKKKYKRTIFIICVISVLISGLNFATTMQAIYPIFGILGIMQIFYIIKY